MLERKNATPENIGAMLSDNSLSMKTKGLLSMLAYDVIDPSLETLSGISSDGMTAIRSSITEAEEAGYLVRERMRDENGRLLQYRWVIDLKRYE